MKGSEFIILHEAGAAWISAPSAEHALKKCHVPGGARRTLAVVEAAYATGTHNTSPQQCDAPFLALIGRPVLSATT